MWINADLWHSDVPSFGADFKWCQNIASNVCSVLYFYFNLKQISRKLFHSKFYQEILYLYMKLPSTVLPYVIISVMALVMMFAFFFSSRSRSRSKRSSRSQSGSRSRSRSRSRSHSDSKRQKSGSRSVSPANKKSPSRSRSVSRSHDEDQDNDRKADDWVGSHMYMTGVVASTILLPRACHVGCEGDRLAFKEFL